MADFYKSINYLFLFKRNNAIIEKMKYKRILLKVSGELFAEDKANISKNQLEKFAQELKELQKEKVEIGLVIGGGNFWRKRDFEGLGLNPSSSDEIGMVATLMNALIFKAFLKSKNIPVEIFSAKAASGFAQHYSIQEADKALSEGKITILAGGTGNPFFTTDSAAVLRALELNAQAVFKGTKVDGVFDSDPIKNPKAKKYEKIKFEEAIEKNLQVMDQTAFSLALEKRLPLVIFNIFEKNSLKKAIKGEKIGTLVF